MFLTQISLQNNLNFSLEISKVCTVNLAKMIYDV
jgi:hypothetical protein